MIGGRSVMKKNRIFLIIIGIFTVGLGIKFAAGSRSVPVYENAVVEDGDLAEPYGRNGKGEMEEAKTQSEDEELEAEMMEKEQQEPEKQDKAAVPELVHVPRPIVRLDGEVGELEYDWNYNKIRVDADTLLLLGGCYFREKKLTQNILFLAKAPDFTLREISRQVDEGWHNDDPDEWMELRMELLHSVDDGYVYEVDGVLYLLDKDFQGIEPICDIAEMMGNLYRFSPDTFNNCDISKDASKLLACTDEGICEYDLESGERELLEPSFFEHHEIVVEEGDCMCGARDFTFQGPVKVEYAPGDQGYAYLTGTEEASWGDVNGAVLRSGEGETIYQKETEYMNGFQWIETEEAVYLAVFYSEGDYSTYWMDRVDINTGEMETFLVPEETFYVEGACVEFLDEDTLFYFNFNKTDTDEEEKNVIEIYHLSSGERQDLVVTGDVEWEMGMLSDGARSVWLVRYPVP